VDSLSALGVVVRVVDHGTFAAAGRELGISASAVGKAIGRLERRVGVRLFQRTSRSVRLTPEGERFVARCRRILNEAEEAESELAQAHGEPRGVLRVNVPEGGEPYRRLLVDFQRAYPAVALEVEMTNRRVDLVRENFDVGLRTGELSDSSLMSRQLGSFGTLLVASPDYLARRGTPQRPSDLKRHDGLMLRQVSTGRVHDLRLHADERDVAFGRVILVASNLDLLIQFAREGRGIVQMLDILAREEIASGSLVPVLRDAVGSEIACHLVWPTRELVSPKLRVFIDFAADRLFTANPGKRIPAASSADDVTGRSARGRART
jgi:DNA-binding transcriptional LysR family regulator